MLFNSYEFIVAFLPIALLGFYSIARALGPGAAQVWLIAASLFYYGGWNPVYLGLILGSAIFNFALGSAIQSKPNSRAPLIFGIIANLALLAWFKYANFFVDNINAVAPVHWTLAKVILPLAISFFTFQQIAFLVDVRQGRVAGYTFREYLLFVVFFPQLIAGPIVHHSEMMPQFARRETYRLQLDNLAVGLTFFAFGLFKKVIIADPLGAQASEVFGTAAAGNPLYSWEAWAGALAYTLQIYFDFSGYTDMAIGLGRMFGIRLPQNFNSPYQAASIADFWRRWHMTLSRFLRDYLYIPLGGNRKGPVRRDINLMATMTLGGLWHGAGWTFILWGIAHGAYLLINHHFTAWRKEKLSNAKSLSIAKQRLVHASAVAFTFFCVVLAWVLFRAENLSAAGAVYEAMFGLHESIEHPRLFKPQIFAFIALLLAFCWFAPNLQRVLASYHQPPDADARHAIAPANPHWHPTLRWAALASFLFLAAFLSLSQQSEFLYYQF
ncbi:MAG: MBOAT family O-acyltransferase [Puniceicoccales bacterium]